MQRVCRQDQRNLARFPKLIVIVWTSSLVKITAQKCIITFSWIKRCAFSNHIYNSRLFGSLSRTLNNHLLRLNVARCTIVPLDNTIFIFGPWVFAFLCFIPSLPFIFFCFYCCQFLFFVFCRSEWICNWVATQLSTFYLLLFAGRYTADELFRSAARGNLWYLKIDLPRVSPGICGVIYNLMGNKNGATCQD